MISAKEIFCLNEQGKRQNNEDRIYPPTGIATAKDNLFIVCDGVGGESKGEVASEIVCKSIHQYINKQKFINGNGKEAIEKAIFFANQKLAEHAATDNTAKRMSTTLSLVFLSEESIIAAWCGDTRIHHIRNGKVIWKSDDHSLVHELVKNGEITEEEARSHPRKNIITRSLNALNTNNTVDFHEIKNFKDDDYLLLCTDGLLEQINEDRIFSILNDERETNKAKYFLSFCEGKTRDNYSMYLIKVGDKAPVKSQGISTSRQFLIAFIIILCVASIVFMFLMIKKNEIASQESLTKKDVKKKSRTSVSDTIPYKTPVQNNPGLKK